MASLQDIKNRIKSVQDIYKVTKAMKMVSIAKLKQAEKNLQPAEERHHLLFDTLNGKYKHMEKADIPALMKKSGNAKKNVYILITSNKGLCGAFNKNIFKLLAKQNETLLSVIPVGKKGIGFCKKENYPVLKEFIFPEARFYYKFSYNLILELLDKFKKNQITQVKVLYNKNISRITQKAGIEELIPYIPDSEQVKKTEVLKHVCEPNDSFLAERLAFEYMVSKLYYILELSETAEHTSRMNAMENASDNALDLLEELKISYNKARQSEITTEIIEIASAAEALKK